MVRAPGGAYELRPDGVALGADEPDGCAMSPDEDYVGVAVGAVDVLEPVALEVSYGWV